MNLGHWSTNKEIDDDIFGFVYQITNILNGKKYIGKKQCVKKIKRKPLKGKKRKRCETVESDWKTYTGSSNELNRDIVAYGKENFKFEILKVCNSKWELSYEEIKEQIKQDVILKESYYNGVINVRIGRPPKNIAV